MMSGHLSFMSGLVYQSPLPLLLLLMQPQPGCVKIVSSWNRKKASCERLSVCWSVGLSVGGQSFCLTFCCLPACLACMSILGRLPERSYQCSRIESLWVWHAESLAAQSQNASEWNSPTAAKFDLSITGLFIRMWPVVMEMLREEGGVQGHSADCEQQLWPLTCSLMVHNTLGGHVLHWEILIQNTQGIKCIAQRHNGRMKPTGLYLMLWYVAL